MDTAVKINRSTGTECHDIFISYGRKESRAFAGKLNKALLAVGYDVWIDQDDLPLGVDFQDQIDKAIEKSHNFLFVIAPHAIASEYCLKEIELALKYKKRIIPVLQVERDLYKVHEEIGKINWVYLREKEDANLPLDQWQTIDDFDKGFSEVQSLLEDNKAFVEQHTHLLLKALEWERTQKDRQGLLVGKERQEAEKWLSSTFSGVKPPCLPSDLHCEYLAEAKKNAENLMTNAFICYATEDIERRDEINRELLRHGFTTWTHQNDIQKGVDYDQAIEEGIERADNLLFFLSPNAVKSEYCLKELEHAQKYNKRIFPLLLSPTDEKELPDVVKKLQYIDFTEKASFQDATNALIGQLNKDKRYYEKHKVFLAQALKWERQGKNPSILLRGYNLQNAQAWLKIGQKRDYHLPTRLHEKFIKESTEYSGQQNIEVFVSYSRTDGDFARKVNEQLQLNGKTTWFDQESIAEGSDFQQEIYKGIESADNFLFIISPDAVQSEFCADEVAYASQLNKRFITLRYRETDPKIMPPALAAVQWIDFEKEDFITAFSQLVRTLDTDREHLQAHTKWQRRAMEWNDKGKDKSLLLRGSEFTIADVWFRESVENNKKPEPTSLQEEFIEESQKAINASLLKERRTTKRLRILLWASIVALVFALGGLYYAFQKEMEAIENEKIAEEKAEEALAAKANAVKAQEDTEKALQKVREEQDKVSKALEALKDKQDELEKEKKSALQARDYARVKQIEAEEAKLKAEKSEMATLLAKSEVELQGLTIGDATKALQIAKNDPTLALRVAHRAYQKNPIEGIEQIIYDIYNENEFYSHSLEDHQDNIYTVSFSPDNQTFISGGRDSKARLWTKNGDLKFIFEQHTNTVLSSAFNSDGSLIITGSFDKTALLWNEKGEIKAEFIGHTLPVWGVDISPDDKYVVTSAKDSTIKLWDINGTLIREFRHDKGVGTVKFSPDGQYILSGSEDNTAKLWNLQGEELLKFQHQDDVESVAFSPDGTKILTGSWDRTTKLWDINGNHLKTLESDYTSTVSFSKPHGRFILTGGNDKSLKLWDLEGNLLKVYKGHKAAIRSAAFSDDGNMIVSGGLDHTVKIWPIEGKTYLPFRDGGSSINSFAFSKKDNSILMKGLNHKAELKNINGDIIKSFVGHEDHVRDVCFSKEADTILTVGKDKQAILWNLDGEEIFSVQDQARLRQAAYSPTGKHFATGNDDYEIVVWNLDGSEESRFKGHEQRITSLEFSSDGESLLSTSADGKAKIWSIHGDILTKIENYKEYIFFGCFSPDNKSILLSGKDNTAKIYDRKGNLTQSFEGHTSYVISAAFSPDQKMVVTGSTDRSVRLWDMDGNIIKIYNDHKDIVNSVLFSPDGKYILSASDDDEVLVRDAIHAPFSFIAKGKIPEFSLKAFALEGLDVTEDFLALGNTNKIIEAGFFYDSLAEHTSKSHQKLEYLLAANKIFEELVKEDKILDGYTRLEIQLKILEGNKKAAQIQSEIFEKHKNAAISQQKVIYYNKAFNPPNNSILSTEYKVLWSYHQKAGDFKEAVIAKENEINSLLETKKKGPAYNSTLSEAYIALSHDLILLKSFEKSLEAAKKGMDLNPNNSHAKSQLAIAYIFNNQLEKAKGLIHELKSSKLIHRESIYEDFFVDNRNSWWKGDENYLGRVENGYYHFESMIDKGAWSAPEIDLDESRDFEIEMKIKYLKGKKNNSLDLVWGKSDDEKYTFGFSANGYYVIRGFLEEEWQDFKEWTKSDIVSGNEYNKLTVRKIGGNYYFFLNETYVHSMPFKALPGKRTGANVLANTAMAVDDFKVSYLNVELQASQSDENLEIKSQESPILKEYSYTIGKKFLEDIKHLESEGITHQSFEKIIPLLVDNVELLRLNKIDAQYFLNSSEPSEVYEAINIYEERVGKIPSYETEKLADTYQVIANLYEKYFALGGDRVVKVDAGSAYWNLSWYKLFTKDFGIAEKAVKRGVELEAEEGIYTNLPTAYLFGGKKEEALKFYREWKEKPYGTGVFREAFLLDLEDLENAGITSKDVPDARVELTKFTPESIKKGWVNVPFSKIDAALYWPNNAKVYLFYKDEYVRWDTKSNTLDEGYPVKTADYWPGVDYDQIDAATYWPSNKKAYFFRGNEYLRFNVELNQVDPGYPKLISDKTWPGLIFDHIDAVITLENGKSYFFSKDEYIRYDVELDRADPGYPKKISELNWYGLDFNHVDAALVWKYPKIIYFNNDQYDMWGIEKQ
ncbi:TIR domain-containing protein [Flexithrix dorotheae]|uniref:TIR domain-containing protein n=1 Tax=Flexithrix dorotheae TaxID=70993 RepID=UPI000378E44C|nr:TIR domain-containing protein [Flexithrix dorotheae]